GDRKRDTRLDHDGELAGRVDDFALADPPREEARAVGLAFLDVQNLKAFLAQALLRILQAERFDRPVELFAQRVAYAVLKRHGLLPGQGVVASRTLSGSSRIS